MRRVIARQEAGGAAPVRVPRGRNYGGVAALVTERVKKTLGRISAKRLLPAARAAGYQGSDRNFRRLVADKTARGRVDLEDPPHVFSSQADCRIEVCRIR